MSETNLELTNDVGKVRYKRILKWFIFDSFKDAIDSGIKMEAWQNRPLEGYHRQLRRVTKTKAAFPNAEAARKLLYLVTRTFSPPGAYPFLTGLPS